MQPRLSLLETDERVVFVFSQVSVAAVVVARTFLGSRVEVEVFVDVSVVFEVHPFYPLAGERGEVVVVTVVVAVQPFLALFLVESILRTYHNVHHYE